MCVLSEMCFLRPPTPGLTTWTTERDSIRGFLRFLTTPTTSSTAIRILISGRDLHSAEVGSCHSPKRGLRAQNGSPPVGACILFTSFNRESRWTFLPVRISIPQILARREPGMERSFEPTNWAVPCKHLIRVVCKRLTEPPETFGSIPTHSNLTPVSGQVPVHWDSMEPMRGIPSMVRDIPIWTSHWKNRPTLSGSEPNLSSAPRHSISSIMQNSGRLRIPPLRQEHSARSAEPTPRESCSWLYE